MIEGVRQFFLRHILEVLTKVLFVRLDSRLWTVGQNTVQLVYDEELLFVSVSILIIGFSFSYSLKLSTSVSNYLFTETEPSVRSLDIKQKEEKIGIFINSSS